MQLLDADDALGAMLLERCEPGKALGALPEAEQDEIIAGLLRRLWRRPLPVQHSFRPLSSMIEHWSAETLARQERWADPPQVREGLRWPGGSIDIPYSETFGSSDVAPIGALNFRPKVRRVPCTSSFCSSTMTHHPSQGLAPA